MVQQGNNLIISTGATGTNARPIAYARSCTIDRQSDLIETCYRTGVALTSDARYYKPGYKGWSINVSTIIHDDMIDPFPTGMEVRIHVGVRKKTGSIVSTTQIQTGMAIVEQAKVTATRGNISQGSFVFRGNGPLEDVEP